MLTLTDIQTLASKADDGWGMPHFQRLLKLIPLIAENRLFDTQVTEWAVYLHDWGAFKQYALPGIEHGLRSRQVVESEILPQAEFPAEKIPLLLEVIEHHDYRDPYAVQSFEAQLFREADFLDFLGAVGMAREFAWGPANLAVVTKRIHSRMDGIRGHFTLPVAQRMAEARLVEMEIFLASLQEEGLGTI